ncbi:hypothetical protein, partial [Marinobacter maroccanus]|uniref:hypothetical protein n=1 Tax=Marinobacter maroccanus TaxID=2055143 RepID=UPI001A7E0743
HPKYLGQRPHELLGQLFKERLSCCSIKAAYSTSFRRLVNRLFFGVFRLRKAPKNDPAYCLFRAAHSTVNRLPVNRFLKNLKTHFLQRFQTVIFRFPSHLSGAPSKEMRILQTCPWVSTAIMKKTQNRPRSITQ